MSQNHLDLYKFYTNLHVNEKIGHFLLLLTRLKPMHYRKFYIIWYFETHNLKTFRSWWLDFVAQSDATNTNKISFQAKFSLTLSYFSGCSGAGSRTWFSCWHLHAWCRKIFLLLQVRFLIILRVNSSFISLERNIRKVINVYQENCRTKNEPLRNFSINWIIFWRLLI